MGQMEDMQTFIRIVDAGSISRAAEQLGMAKSALSRRLSDLETRLNVQLLNRTTRKSSLSDAGRNYYLRASQIIADANELQALTSNASTTLEGDLRVAVPYTFGLLHLTPLINEFAALHPGINFQLDFSDRQVDLVEEGFDVAIRIADLKSSSHIARKIAPIKLVLCASKKYLAKAGTPQHPKDLRNHTLLGYNGSTGSPYRFADPNGMAINLRLPEKMRANNGDYLCAAALAGLGITTLPTFIAGSELKTGKLLPVLPQYTLPGLNAYALYPQTRHLSQRVRVFVDFLAHYFGTIPYWDNNLTPR